MNRNRKPLLHDRSVFQQKQFGIRRTFLRQFFRNITIGIITAFDNSLADVIYLLCLTAQIDIAYPVCHGFHYRYRHESNQHNDRQDKSRKSYLSHLPLSVPKNLPYLKP